MSLRRLVAAFLPSLGILLIACAPSMAEVNVSVAPDHEDGVYALGETVTWTVRVADEGQPVAGEVAWVVRRGGLTQLAAGTVALQDGQATVTARHEAPGCLLLTATHTAGDDTKTEGLGGAVFAPDQIMSSADEPADFDEFWNGKLAALAAIPPNPKLTPVDVGVPEIEYFKIEMAGWNGTTIQGQMARPKGGTNLPGLLQVQWAGVYPLDRNWVVGPAKDGWLALNLMAHDLPIDEPAAFYQQANETTLKNYPTMGREDRETSYFLRMYLAVYRTIDFLIAQPEWNGRTVVVQGSSQGGGQSLVAAGIHPAVTAIMANVPAMCDHTGQLVGRAAGWPKLTGWGQTPDSEAALAASPYFDAVNFARRAHCQQALIGVGLIDVTCPPEGVIAAYNALPCAKSLAIMPLVGHNGNHDGYYQQFGNWMWKLKAGLDPLAEP